MENNKNNNIIRDERGTHENGVGWDPTGRFCGECGSTNCSQCGVWLRTKQNLNGCKK